MYLMIFALHASVLLNMDHIRSAYRHTQKLLSKTEMDKTTLNRHNEGYPK